MKVTGPAPKGRTGTTITFSPDPSIFEDVEFRAQTVVERLQIMAFLNRGLEMRFVDERPGREAKETFKYNGGIVDYVRHLNNTKESLFRKVGFFEQSEEGQELEIAFQWNTGYYEIHLLLRERHRHHRRRHARRGVPQGPHQRHQPLRAQAQPVEGEGREPQGRGHPRGADGDRLGAPAQPAVRGPDEGQARQRLDPLDGGARDQREAGRLARGEPPRGRPDRREVDLGLAGAHGGPGGEGLDASQERARRRGAARQARRLLVERPARVRTLHRRGQLGRGIGEGRAQPAHPGDPAHSRQDPQRREGAFGQDPDATPRSRRSSRRSAPGSRASSTSRRSATTRSSCSPTPTSTAATSARCCSPSSSAR